MNALVIVESPAKSKTIRRYLGDGYQVLASYGHVRDLIPKTGAVDPKQQFAMHYQLIERNEKHVKAIIDALKKHDILCLATDPDREGEAISWHLCEHLKAKGLLEGKTIQRVVFHEITQNAIQQAIANPRSLSMDLVNAQQARRALDYLVGFTLSPLLWKKIRRGLSAGRVQSPALRLIVEREEEIQAFEPQEYWRFKVDCLHETQPFSAKLHRYFDKKVEQFRFPNEESSKEAEAILQAASSNGLKVTAVEKKQRKRQPSPPFMTSTMQQEASRKLGFGAQRTMRAAQSLYEAGLITYMRTDSLNLSQDALVSIREFITQAYGEKSCPEKPRHFKNKSKNAQEAHEAIRPTDPHKVPRSLTKTLEGDTLKLYKLIWQRAIASQMQHATLNTLAVDLACVNDLRHQFRANGTQIHDPGFLAVYQSNEDSLDTEEHWLPPMKTDERIQVEKLHCTQHFTEPPPRYSEASLIKALEEFGIGRPSTYASIISTLQQREYVELNEKRFYPTDTGSVVNRFLTKFFTQYVDYHFTAHLEDELDDIARGEKTFIPILEKFWEPFQTLITNVDQNVSRDEVTQEALDEACPKCKKSLNIRLGRRGRFIGCSGYPDCDYTRNMEGEETNSVEILEDRSCPKCESPLCKRQGRYGPFIGCTAYPKCRFIEAIAQKTGVQCPQCHQGDMQQRRSKRQKVFYSCSRYPDCQYAIWDPPLAEPCPECKWPMLTIKSTKRQGDKKVCPQKNCRYTDPYIKENTPSNE